MIVSPIQEQLFPNDVRTQQIVIMKSSTRLLATVKSGRFLTPGNPTGLTGLSTHPAPRAQLLFLYGSTLSKLAQLPEHSVYRQSAEALTRSRLEIVRAQKPEGYEQWLENVQKMIDSHPDKFGKGTKPEELAIEPRSTSEEDDRDLNWNGQEMYVFRRSRT